jgi:hypothetical protein
MIQHIVLVRFRADVTTAEKAAIYADLERLRERVPGMTGFRAGPNTSPEGLDKGFADGFVATFSDAPARDGYLADDEHGKVGGRLVSMTEGGVDGILVFDLATG